MVSSKAAQTDQNFQFDPVTLKGHDIPAAEKMLKVSLASILAGFQVRPPGPGSTAALLFQAWTPEEAACLRTSNPVRSSQAT